MTWLCSSWWYRIRTQQEMSQLFKSEKITATFTELNLPAWSRTLFYFYFLKFVRWKTGKFISTKIYVYIERIYCKQCTQIEHDNCLMLNICAVFPVWNTIQYISREQLVVWRGMRMCEEPKKNKKQFEWEKRGREKLKNEMHK